MLPAIQMFGVSKSFRSLAWRPFRSAPPLLVLDNLSLAIQPGEMALLTGANGAGKTTLLRLLAGLLTPDAGEILVERRELRFISGDERGFYGPLTGRQNLRFFAALDGLDARETEQQIETLAKRWYAAGFLDRPVQELSTGQRQRLSIVRSQLYPGKILLADEPTRSLDAATRDRFHEWIFTFTSAGGAAFLSTHSAQEHPSAPAKQFVLAEGKVRTE